MRNWIHLLSDRHWKPKHFIGKCGATIETSKVTANKRLVTCKACLFHMGKPKRIVTSESEA